MKTPTKILLAFSGLTAFIIAIGRLLIQLSTYQIYYNPVFHIFQYHNLLLPLVSVTLILAFIYEVLTWKTWAQFYSDLVKNHE